MTEFTSLWAEAGRDAEADADAARLTRAKVAAAGVWPFLAIAQSDAEFDHRLALADEALRRTVEAPMLDGVRTALREDFQALRGFEGARRGKDGPLDQSVRCKNCKSHLWKDSDGDWRHPKAKDKDEHVLEVEHVKEARYSVAANDPQSVVEPTQHRGHGQGDVCTSACFTPRAAKESRRVTAAVSEEERAAIIRRLHDNLTVRQLGEVLTGRDTHDLTVREHSVLLSHYKDDPRTASLQATAEIFDNATQRWVRLADVNRVGPPGDGQLEQGPNTGQTGFPPLATDPINPINQMFPMQPTGWGNPTLPQDLNAATGQPVQYGTNTASRLPFARSADAQRGYGQDSSPFDHANNPFSGGAGFAETGGGTPQTTPPRQIPGGTGGGFETGQPVGDVTDTSPSDEAAKQRQVGRPTAGVVRERPTMDNPNGLADEYVSNHYETPLKMAPRQAPEDRGVNTPTVPQDTIAEMSSDIPRPGDNEESEGEEKQSRVKQGFSAREDGPAMFPVICHACQRTGSVERVTASLRCACGSNDLDLWDGIPAAKEPPTFLAFMQQTLAGFGANPMSNGRPVPFPCPVCRGGGRTAHQGICRYCNGVGRVAHFGEEDRPPAVAPHEKTAAPRGKPKRKDGQFDVEQHIRDTTRGYGGRDPENETVRPSTKRKDHSMGVAPAYRPHYDYDAEAPKKPFETGHRCPSCGHGVTYLAPDYKGDSWLTCPKEGPLINVDRGAGLKFNPEAPPEDWSPSARSFKAPEKTAGARKKPKALQIAEGVVATNPGIRGLAAYRIAQRTVARFPAVAGR